MILKARAVVPMDGPPLENGAIAIDGNTIVAVGDISDFRWLDAGPIVDLGDAVIMPGLINAHCHLDYTMFRRAINPPKSFTAWVQRINSLKRTLDSDDYLKSIAKGFDELRKWGTTSVCNIESFPELMPRMPDAPIRTWWFYEMIDIRHRFTTDDVIMGALSFFQKSAASLSRFGLSPHAPYTASRQLFDLANSCASTMTMLLTTHVAESAEEKSMFKEGFGPLFDLMKGLGRPMDDCGKGAIFSQLWNKNAINSNWLLAHMNELEEEDFTLLGEISSTSLPHVVHCPGSHAYFQHSAFQYRRLHELGINICIGTDSLASTDSLSLFKELRLLSQTNPWLSSEQLLRTVTINPARALKRERRLGSIVPGALADLIAFPISGDASSAYDEIVNYKNPVPWMMIDGKIRTR